MVPSARRGSRHGANGETEELRVVFAVERRALHVTRGPEGLAGETQNGGVVDEPVDDGDGLRFRRHKLAPLLERQIGDHDRRGRSVSGVDDAEQIIGVLAIQVAEAGVLKNQKVRLGDAPERLSVGMVGPRGQQRLQHLAHRGVEHMVEPACQ